MNENESRKARKRAEAENENRTENDSANKGISNMYYWIIGILFVVLIGLTIFLFTRGGDDVNLENDNNQATTQQEETSDTNNNEEETTESTADEESAETPEDESEDPEEETEEPTEEENETDTDNTDEPETVEPGENVTVDDDAPLNENYAVDYSDGSADRTAIRNQVMQTTGLGSDLIEWWVGNNGPGRVEATVSNRDQTDVYRVYLQHGDGSWHVTSYERLSEVPASLR